VFNSDRSDRVGGLPVMAGSRSTQVGSARLVTLLVTGIADNSYCRSGETVMRVPYARMNEALQRIGRLGGRVVEVRVN
jgi:hypothetical protein